MILGDLNKLFKYIFFKNDFIIFKEMFSNNEKKLHLGFISVY